MTPPIQTPVPHEQRGRKPGPKPGHNSEVRANHRSEIARLLRTGKTYAEIVEQVGCGHDLVSAVAKAIAVPKEVRRETARQRMAAEVKALLLANKTYEEVIAETGATKYLIWNVACEIGKKPKAKADGLWPRPSPTHCTKTEHCTCTWHQAEAVRLERLAKYRNEIKAKGVR
jgi:uncharacterized protein YerC